MHPIGDVDLGGKTAGVGAEHGVALERVEPNQAGRAGGEVVLLRVFVLEAGVLCADKDIGAGVDAGIGADVDPGLPGHFGAHQCAGAGKQAERLGIGARVASLVVVGDHHQATHIGLTVGAEL